MNSGKLIQRIQYLLVFDVLLLIVLVVWVVAQAIPSSEAVRLRNALLFAGQKSPAQFNWTPTAVPQDFLLEKQPLPPELTAVVQSLDLAKESDNWLRAKVIAHHLHAKLNTEKGPISSDLNETYQRIVGEGAGYCGDYAMVFTALANAAGIPNRAWAFSFDGFGGHGHIFNEIWDDKSQEWRAIDVFNNYVFVDSKSGAPLSALAFRSAMRSESGDIQIVILNPTVRPGFKIHEKAIDYYRRGLSEWYQPWGNNVAAVDGHPLVKALSPLSRHLRVLAGILAGIQPSLFIVETPENKASVEKLSTLRTKLLVAGILAIVLLFIGLILAIARRLLHHSPRRVIPNPATDAKPSIVVFSMLFPSPKLPQAGIFIRERMFRVGDELPLTVVSPRPWFPFQGLLRIWKPHFRPSAPSHEIQLGVEVFRPRFLSLPGILKNLDGLFLAMFCYPTLFRLKKQGRMDILDAHFAYPDGYAAVRLGIWLGVPVTVTLRGTESRHLNDPTLAPLVFYTLKHASRVFAVAKSLLDLAHRFGLPQENGLVVGNGVDSERFHPISQTEARAKLNLPRDAKILVTVGGLVERKGFHRVIEQIPRLMQTYPNLHYLVVGSGGPEGDFSTMLHTQVVSLGLQSRVHFLGSRAPDELNIPLSAADVFVLATRNEGWANVILEAMACGLPVVTTDVGGNSEVVAEEYLGKIVPFGDGPLLAAAIDSALTTDWDRDAIRAYAQENCWSSRVSILVDEFRSVVANSRPPSSRIQRGKNNFGIPNL